MDIDQERNVNSGSGPVAAGVMKPTLGSHRSMHARRNSVTTPLGAVAAACLTAILAAGCTNGPLVEHALTRHFGRQPRSHVATAALGLRRSAELDVVNGATSLSVTTASLGSELLRVATPANSGIRPDLIIGSTVQLYLDATGGSGPASVQVVLNSAVTWHLLFAGGASQTTADLSSGRFGGADFAAGSSLIAMTLPRPTGTITVELAGGASQVSLGLPAGVPAELQLDGGASSALLLGHAYTGIAGGTVLTSPGWAGARARYLIEAPAGMSAINVTG
jgi:hypothetical protein